MKHFGWLRKAAASVLALAMFAAAPAALAYSDANLEAPRAKNVVIDGDLSERDQPQRRPEPYSVRSDRLAHRAVHGRI